MDFSILMDEIQNSDENDDVKELTTLMVKNIIDKVEFNQSIWNIYHFAKGKENDIISRAEKLFQRVKIKLGFE